MSIPIEKINDLLKKLPDEDKKEVLNYTEFLIETKKRAFKEFLENVPEEDEELSPEEIEALKEAEEDVKAGRVKNLEEVKPLNTDVNCIGENTFWKCRKKSNSVLRIFEEAPETPLKDKSIPVTQVVSLTQNQHRCIEHEVPVLCFMCGIL